MALQDLSHYLVWIALWKTPNMGNIGLIPDSGGTQWVKATPAPRSVSTAVFGWSSMVPL